MEKKVQVIGFYMVKGWRYIAADGEYCTKTYDSPKKAREAWEKELVEKVWKDEDDNQQHTANL